MKLGMKMIKSGVGTKKLSYELSKSLYKQDTIELLVGDLIIEAVVLNYSVNYSQPAVKFDVELELHIRDVHNINDGK